MRKVLVIAYWFPPLIDSGIQRTVKMVKYLPSYGWNPVILTAKHAGEETEKVDHTFNDDLSEYLNIYRAGYIKFGDILNPFGSIKHDNKIKSSGQESLIRKYLRSAAIPDVRISWYPFAVNTASQIFMENDIDIIYSTSPYPTAHLIAKTISRKYRKPWVADFRDPWSKIFLVNRANIFKKIEENMERKVLEFADKVVVAWPGIKDNLVLPPKEIEEKTEVIHNGFDEDDFKDVIPRKFRKFTIVYSGTLYKERNLTNVFISINELLQKNKKLRKKIQVVIIGRKNKYTEKAILKNKLEDIVQITGYLSHKECLNYMNGADVLLLNSIQNYVPGKTFEYLRSRKPIITMADANTTVADIVKSTKSGVIVNPKNTKEIQRALMNIYTRYKKGHSGLKYQDLEGVYQYDRKYLAGKFASVFNDLTSKK
jgi:glycosyltransferase involved in cell wall biosynthesis